MTETKKPKICFVASGGGHLRQLLQLAPLQAEYPYYFVTEKTSLGESLVKDHRTHFVPHFAFGQRETEGMLSFLRSGISNALVSTWHFFREWPAVVITSGAGAAFVTVAWARIFGKKIVYLESIARVTEVSLFGRLGAKHAGLCIVQWPGMVDKLKGATYCSPLVVDNAPDTQPREGVLVTVGTVMPFDRMVHGVETLVREGKISGDVAAQIGESTEKFEGMETFASCPFEELNVRMGKADVVICHGGSGSILGALKAGAHVVAMARLHKFGEHYDDHQQDITKAFADMKLISVAIDEHDIERAIAEATSRPRKTVNIDPSEYLVAIRNFIQKENKPMRSLHQLKHVRKILVKAKYLIYTKVWGMDIHPTCNFSLSAKFDRTYPKGMHIGAHTYVAFDAAILCHDMTRGLYLDTYIGENCFIGARSIILPGIKIGNGCIVGAGSIVTKDVPDGCAVAGNPAQIIRKSIEVGHFGRLTTADENEKRLLGEAA